MMKYKLIGWTLIATSLSGAAGANALNYADANSTFDLQDMTMTPLVGGVTSSPLVFSHPLTSASANDISMTPTVVNGSNAADAMQTYALASARVNPTTNDLGATVYVTAGAATAQAQETLSFTLTHTGLEEISIPYSLYSTAQSQNTLTWTGSSMANVMAQWGPTDSFSFGGQNLNTSAGPGGGPLSTASTLNLLLNNTQTTHYTFTLSSLATANFAGPDPAAVPELPMPLLLSLGMLLPLITRRSRLFMNS
jgi:hypothetical protein